MTFSCFVFAVGVDFVVIGLLETVWRLWWWRGNEVCGGGMEGVQGRSDKLQGGGAVNPRSRFRVWFIRACSSIVLWTCLFQLVTVSELWRSQFFLGITSRIQNTIQRPLQAHNELVHPPPTFLPPS